jgi:hypothetical protein
VGLRELLWKNRKTHQPLKGVGKFIVIVVRERPEDGVEQVCELNLLHCCSAAEQILKTFSKGGEGDVLDGALVPINFTTNVE